MIDCKFENGAEAKLRHLVVDAVIVQDEKILLVKRAAHLHEGGKWALPGGFVERDETAIEAVMREVLEETGYTCDVQELITVIDKPNRRGDDRQNVAFVFAAQTITKTKQRDAESTAVEWFPITALPSESDMAFDHLEIIWEWIKQHDPNLPPAD